MNRQTMIDISGAHHEDRGSLLKGIRSSYRKTQSLIVRALFYIFHKSALAKAQANPEVAFAKAEELQMAKDQEAARLTEYGPAFQSRFKDWMRLVALTVLIVFIPEQISWAFNYNPAVLWSRRGADGYLSAKANGSNMAI